MCHDCQGSGEKCVLFIVAHFCCGARGTHCPGGDELFQNGRAPPGREHPRGIS
ncbi:hypothetical protein AX27061_0495 [Achromobacter xylosoxidans NBRC 15126 = ATCC 27061]|nr:hypothetical protein AX27061_0495 [Achromobacter xylosoxidans NBRC 15126 = ATCC 27061]